MHSIATSAPSLPSDFAVPLPTGVALARRAVPLAASRILGTALLIMALLMLNTAGTIGSAVCFVILTAMIFVSPEAAFKSLAIFYLGLMVNSFFVPKSSVLWSPARIVLPSLALLRFSIDLSTYRLSVLNRPGYVGLLCFCGTMAVCSMLSGWYTQIALLKVFYFLLFVSTVFAGTVVLRHRRTDLGEWFVALILATTLFGIAAVALNVDSNFRQRTDVTGRILAGSSFNGAFGHPNVHAIYGTMFITFLATVGLLGAYRQRWLVLPMMACWATFIAWSASRTAFLSTAAGILILIVAAKPARNRLGWRMRPRVSRGALIGLLTLAVVLGLFLDVATDNSLGKALSSFMAKGGTSKSATGYKELNIEKIMQSRQALIDFSWNNFLDSPFFGIGFGVAKTEVFRRTATYLTAPAEKGFLPTAILEEGGLIGTAAFVIFLGLFCRELVRQRNVAGLVTFLAFLVTNLGEMTLFAPGGAGGFGWLLVGAAMIFNDHCWTPPRAGAPALAVNHQWRR